MTGPRDTVQEKLKELRKLFSSQLPGKVRQIEEAWDGLLRDGCEPGKAEHTAQLLHTLAGTAGTFGFAAIRTAAKNMEAMLRKSMPAGRLPSDAAELLAELKGGCGESALSSLAPASQELALEPPAYQPDSDEIFFVDDDPLVAEAISLQLRYFGYKVAAFSTIDSVVAALKEKTPLLIIMDLTFPEGRNAGANAIAEIQRRRKSLIPVVFLSVRSDFKARLDAVRTGGDAYFVKPVDVGRLADRIDILTARKPPDPFRILIVDDEPLLADYHATILRQAGMMVAVETDSELAMEALVEFKPEMILMDVYMPGCSGMELASVIRQDETFIDIPIVYLSSEIDLTRQLVAMSRGGDDFLTKPIEPSHLITSVTLRADRYRTLRYFMQYDGLTGLLNHTRTVEQLDVEVARANRKSAEFCFAMIDLDHFKSINDTHGHLVGDLVIKSLSRLLKQRLRKMDTVGRIGGEEFGIILSDTDGPTAQAILNKLREDFGKIRHTSEHGEFSTTFSCGLACAGPGSLGIAIMAAADKALYGAKRRGRNRVIFAGTGNATEG